MNLPQFRRLRETREEFRGGRGMSGEAWGKGSGFIAGSSEEHGGRMY